eukprot:CAMPEP_0197233676 /NCGR_PEP_ID=MMETSP1429-20130617/1681_1 /TAXON_ID=49237 /ORGANISM="Chaetoceros  sp., Strain UNC1202" /LENGTH=175 /DNA_ID=CAMNT_0042691973 /DNA_START=57 /DNA_END=583 /DNA_ORIENTATION=-
MRFIQNASASGCRLREAVHVVDTPSYAGKIYISGVTHGLMYVVDAGQGVSSDKRYRNLLSRCRESGEYCIDHGLVFPFELPTLVEPYEPRTEEMEQRLASVRNGNGRRNGRIPTNIEFPLQSLESKNSPCMEMFLADQLHATYRLSGIDEGGIEGDGENISIYGIDEGDDIGHVY